MNLIAVWQLRENLEIKIDNAYYKIQGITDIQDSSSLEVVKHKHYDLKGRNTAEVLSIDESYTITVDVLAEGVDKGNSKLVSMAHKIGDEAKADMRFKNPYVNETMEFVASFSLTFGNADNVGTVTGTMHIDGEPTIVSTEPTIVSTEG